MTTDKAEWHYGGEFPEDLPNENGATHIGMFLAWIINNNLQGEFFDEEMADGMSDLRNRKITGREFLVDYCDEVLMGEEFNEKGATFGEVYYENDYALDYEETLAKNLPTIYHVADNWENYDKIAKVIDRRFIEWKKLNESH